MSRLTLYLKSGHFLKLWLLYFHLIWYTYKWRIRNLSPTEIVTEYFKFPILVWFQNRNRFSLRRKQHIQTCSPLNYVGQSGAAVTGRLVSWCWWQLSFSIYIFYWLEERKGGKEAEWGANSHRFWKPNCLGLIPTSTASCVGVPVASWTPSASTSSAEDEKDGNSTCIM